MDEILFLKLYYLFNIQCQTVEHLRNNVDSEILKNNDEYYKTLLSPELQKYASIWFNEILSDSVIQNINNLEHKYSITRETPTILKSFYRAPTVLKIK